MRVFRSGWLIVLCVLAAAGVVASASAQNQRALHYSMTVMLQGTGTGNVYGCSEIPYLGPNPTQFGPGYTIPPCINPGFEDSCGSTSVVCGWSQFNGGTTLTRDLANPKNGAASLNIAASSTAQAVTDCITANTANLQGNHVLSFWYRTTSGSAGSVYAQVQWYSDGGCSTAQLINSSPAVGAAPPTANGQWNTISGNVTAPNFTASARVLVAIAGSNVAANFDDVVLAPLLAGRTISCPGNCSENAGIQNDKNFILVATPMNGSTFASWGGTCQFNSSVTSGCTTCAPYGSSPICTLSEAEGVTDEDVVATFAGPTLITVRFLSAKRERDGVTVRWRTGADAGILGFNVYRELKSGLRLKLNRALIPAASSPAANEYRWLDRTAPQRGRLRYWIEEKLLKGTPQWYGPAVSA